MIFIISLCLRAIVIKQLFVIQVFMKNVREVKNSYTFERIRSTLLKIGSIVFCKGYENTLDQTIDHESKNCNSVSVSN